MRKFKVAQGCKVKFLALQIKAVYSIPLSKWYKVLLYSLQSLSSPPPPPPPKQSETQTPTVTVPLPTKHPGGFQ